MLFFTKHWSRSTERSFVLDRHHRSVTYIFWPTRFKSEQRSLLRKCISRRILTLESTRWKKYLVIPRLSDQGYGKHTRGQLKVLQCNWITGLDSNYSLSRLSLFLLLQSNCTLKYPTCCSGMHRAHFPTHGSTPFCCQLHCTSWCCTTSRQCKKNYDPRYKVSRIFRCMRKARLSGTAVIQKIHS